MQDLRLPFAQEVRQPALGNVARDPGHAEDFVAIVAQRHFRRRDPRLVARGAEYAFLHVDDRLPGPDDPLFIGIEFIRDLRRQELKVRLADQIGRPGKTHSRRRDLVGDDEAALDVLDPKVVRQPVDQGLQRQQLLRRSDRGLEFGNILMRRDPAAARHRLVADLNRPPVR